MNQFGDLTLDEYRFFFLGLRSHFSNETKREGSTFLPPSGVTLPDTVDWRTKGYVTPVKNQGMLTIAIVLDLYNLLYCIVLYCIVLYCIVLYCIVLYCTVLYCTVLYCIVLYCIVL